MNYPIIESVGIEFETDYVDRGNINRSFNDNFSTEHDASIESYSFYHNGITFKNRVKPNDNSRVIGCEFKSKVFTFNTKEDLYSNLCSFLSSLEEYGDSYESKRSGIHVHICSPYNLNILKSILRVCAHLEQVFFYLGGMGYENRGIQNEFSFCRPITKFGPSVVRINSNTYCQCFNLNDLYNTTGVGEFFYRYGSIDISNPPGKYNPTRYHWITLYPLLTYGTVEYRIFNKTYSPLYLYTIIKFCQQVTLSAISGKINNLEENSIYDYTTKDNIIKTLNTFIRKFDLQMTQKEIDTLENIIYNTPEIKLKPRYCLSHLYERNEIRNLFSINGYHPELVNINSNCIVPKVVTIHNIEVNNNPILG